MKELIKSKMKICLEAISRTSSSSSDAKAAEAVEHLAKALFYLEKIAEEEKDV